MIWVKYCNSRNLHGRYILQYKSCLTIQTQHIEVRFEAITIEFNSMLAYTAFHFSQTLPQILEEFTYFELLNIDKQLSFRIDIKINKCLAHHENFNYINFTNFKRSIVQYLTFPPLKMSNFDKVQVLIFPPLEFYNIDQVQFMIFSPLKKKAYLILTSRTGILSKSKWRLSQSWFSSYWVHLKNTLTLCT